MQLQQEKLIAISYLLRKCGLLAHTSAAFLKNCCTEKLFIRLRLVLGKPPESGSARLGHIPELQLSFQLQQEKLVAISYLLRKCGLLAHTSAAFLKNCCTEKLFICASHLLNRKPPLPIRKKRFQLLFCLMWFGIRSSCFLCQFCLFL